MSPSAKKERMIEVEYRCRNCGQYFSMYEQTNLSIQTYLRLMGKMGVECPECFPVEPHMCGDGYADSHGIGDAIQLKEKLKLH